MKNFFLSLFVFSRPSMWSRQSQLLVCTVSLTAMFVLFVIMPHLMSGKSPLYTLVPVAFTARDIHSVEVPLEPALDFMDRLVGRDLMLPGGATMSMRALEEACSHGASSIVVRGVTFQCAAHKKARLNG